MEKAIVIIGFVMIFSLLFGCISSEQKETSQQDEFMDFSECNALEDNVAQNRCKNLKFYKDKPENYCEGRTIIMFEKDQVLEGPLVQSICWTNLAGAKKDPSLCENLSESIDTCKLTVAILNKDSTLCEALSEGLVSYCKQRVAEENN